MSFKVIGFVLAGVACCNGTAAASIVGQTNRATVRVGTGYFADGGNGPFVEVDARQLYAPTSFAFGGGATSMQALGAGWRDLQLSTSVVDVGTHRTVTLSMATLDGAAILDQSVVTPLIHSDFYFLSFSLLDGSPSDDQMAPPSSYTYTLLGMAGKQSQSSGTSGSIYLLGGSTYYDSHSPAGPSFFGLTPRGYSMKYEYTLVPSPGSCALLVGATSLASQRRRRMTCSH